MALDWRQIAAYRHLIHIVRVSETINSTTGAVGAETYTLVQQNVPCLMVPTDNVDTVVQGGGRLKNPSLFTMDTFHMEVSIDIRDADIIKNVSVYPDGTPTPENGTYARVLGAPKHIASAGNRRANKLSIRTMSIEKVPAGIPI